MENLEIEYNYMTRHQYIIDIIIYVVDVMFLGSLLQV